ISARRRIGLEAPVQTILLVPGQPLVFSSVSGAGIALSDPEAGPLDPAMDLTLSASSGRFALSSLDGLAGSGDGTGTLHYRGSLTALNGALTGLRYTPPPGFHGNCTVSLEVRSGGVMLLQPRLLVSDRIFPVTTASDAGPGSLRQAILDANTATGGNN